MKTARLFFALLLFLRAMTGAAEILPPSPPKANEELSQLFRDDQADRTPQNGVPIDWRVVSKRDEARLKRVKELYAANELKTGGDYFHAGMILQHGDTSEDYLLCHELCVAAVAKGSSDPKSWFSSAKWLAAASEDRFLLSIGRPQRFGTQSTSEGDGPVILDKVEDGVTDTLRKDFGVPPLSEAKAKVASRNENAKKQNQASDPPVAGGVRSP
jgi:hypothetical protein